MILIVNICPEAIWRMSHYLSCMWSLELCLYGLTKAVCVLELHMGSSDSYVYIALCVWFTGILILNCFLNNQMVPGNGDSVLRSRQWEYSMLQCCEYSLPLELLGRHSYRGRASWVWTLCFPAGFRVLLTLHSSLHEAQGLMGNVLVPNSCELYKNWTNCSNYNIKYFLIVSHFLYWYKQPIQGLLLLKAWIILSKLKRLLVHIDLDRPSLWLKWVGFCI